MCKLTEQKHFLSLILTKVCLDFKMTMRETFSSEHDILLNMDINICHLVLILLPLTAPPGGDLLHWISLMTNLQQPRVTMFVLLTLSYRLDCSRR